MEFLLYNIVSLVAGCRILSDRETRLFSYNRILSLVLCSLFYAAILGDWMLFTMPLSVIFQTPLSLEQLPIFMADMALAYLTV